MNGYVLAGAFAVIVVLIIVFAVVIPMTKEPSVTGLPSTIGPPTVRKNPRKLRNMRSDEDGWD